MIRYIKNVLTGTFAHWNENHNKMISDLWNKGQNFNQIEKVMAQQSIVASMQITDSYIGPNRKKGLVFYKVSDKQVKSLMYSDYNNILKELIKLFLTLLSIRNDVLQDYSTSTYNKLFDDSFEINDDLKSIDKKQIKQIVFSHLGNFTNAAKIIKNEDPGLTMSFFTLVTSQIEPMEHEILKEINN